MCTQIKKKKEKTKNQETVFIILVPPQSGHLQVLE
jgi:hypothetical protein